MGISPGQARTRVELACELVEELPAVVDALAASQLDLYKAKVLAEETRPLADHPDLRRDIAANLSGKAARRSGPQLRAAARKAVLAADPASAKNATSARKSRSLHHRCASRTVWPRRCCGYWRRTLVNAELPETGPQDEVDPDPPRF